MANTIIEVIVPKEKLLVEVSMGIKGERGVSISDAVLNENGHFIVTYDNGEIVDSGITAFVDAVMYRDEAKGYSEQAGEYATSSQQSSQDATSAKNAAEDSETKAKQSETNAKSSETSAQGYSEEAATQATDARNSAIASSTNASNALVSETNAKESENNAKASEDEAKSSETASANSATSASNSAIVATQQATDATNQATLAKDWATKTDDTVDGSEYSSKYYSNLSKTSETNAKTSETNAKTSETNAKASETSLASHDSNAASSAASAVTSATNAAQSAGSAASSATTATNQAIASANSATSASGSATAASNSATASANSAQQAQDYAKSMGAAVNYISGNNNGLAIESISGAQSTVTLDQMGLGGVYKFKGPVATYADLPSTGVSAGWVYNIVDTGKNYAYTPEGTWDDLGGTVDLSSYSLKTDAVKDIAGSSAVLTITKGDGTTSTITVNNVANATHATTADSATTATSADLATKATQDGSGNNINSTYLKLSGGTMTGNPILKNAVPLRGNTASGKSVNLAFVSPSNESVLANASLHTSIYSSTVPTWETDTTSHVFAMTDSDITGRAASLTPTAIPSGSDLNNYTTPGWYCATSNDIAASMTNSPSTTAFTLEVIPWSGTYGIIQRIVQFNTGKLYIRSSSDNNSSWIRWTDQSMSTFINANSDLRNYTTPGSYYCDTDTSAATLSNCPVTNAFSLEVIRWGRTNNVIQRLTRYTDNRVYLCRLNGTVWSSWVTQAFSSDLSSYLPLAGGVMTGGITLPNGSYGLSIKNSSGGGYNVLSFNSDNKIYVGNTSYPLIFNVSTNPVCNIGGITKTLAMTSDIPASTIVSITLSSASWSSGTYTYSNSSITANSKVTIVPNATNTTGTMYDAIAAGKLAGTVSAGQVVIKALGTAPTIDVTCDLLIEG